MLINLKQASAGALILAAAAMIVPRQALADATQIVVRCALAQACSSTKNTIGAGLQGITAGTSGLSAGVRGLDSATNTGYNDGVLGIVTNGGYGVDGTSGDNALGGVRGIATTGIGTYGRSSSSYGAFGTSATSAGVVGTSFSSSGVYAASSSGTGLEAHSSTGSAGRFFAGNGTAIEGNTSTGYGLIARTGGSVGAYVTNSNGNGTDITGSYIGLLGRSNAYPMLLTNASAANLFYVDGSGNVWSHGTYNTFARTRSGQSTLAYSPQTTAPSVEDVGAAQLVNGTATIRFDTAFAASIDGQSAYHVFLTPGGDTRGLFVAVKTPTGFVVRETQGGRGTLSFDYRIVASAVGRGSERMAFVRANSNAAPAAEPKAPLVKLPLTAPSIIRKPTERKGRPEDSPLKF